jgi:hypothetical protein
MATGANFSAEDEIKHLRARLRAFETEQLTVRARPEELERQRTVFEAASSELNTFATPPVTMASSSSAKLRCFVAFLPDARMCSQFVGTIGRPERADTRQPARTSG